MLCESTLCEIGFAEKKELAAAASRAALFAFSSIKIIGDGRDENEDCQSVGRGSAKQSQARWRAAVGLRLRL